MTTEEWPELRERFRHYVVHRGDRTIEDVAQEIGIARRTVYNLMQDDEVTPHRLVREAIERACNTAQPDSDT